MSYFYVKFYINCTSQEKKITKNVKHNYYQNDKKKQCIIHHNINFICSAKTDIGEFVFVIIESRNTRLTLSILISGCTNLK